MQDTTLTCGACSGSFVFTASEQAYYAERGFQFPKRCRSCRQARRRGRRRSQQSSISGSLPAMKPMAPRDTYPASCVDCGEDMKLPFRLQSPPRCPGCFCEEYSAG